MKLKYSVILLLIMFNACNYAETENEVGIEYIEEEDKKVLNELFKNQQDVVSRSSVKVNLHKTKNDKFVEEIGQIYWYQHWSFDSLKNEYIPKGEVVCRLKNDNSRITLWQEARSEGIEYYNHDEIQEWYPALYLIVKKKDKYEQQHSVRTIELTMNNRGWLFTKAIEFTYEKGRNEDGVIVLDAKNSMGSTGIHELPTDRKKYYCKFDYSNIILSPNNHEVLRELCDKT